MEKYVRIVNSLSINYRSISDKAISQINNQQKFIPSVYCTSAETPSKQLPDNTANLNPTSLPHNNNSRTNPPSPLKKFFYGLFGWDG